VRHEQQSEKLKIKHGETRIRISLIILIAVEHVRRQSVNSVTYIRLSAKGFINACFRTPRILLFEISLILASVRQLSMDGVELLVMRMHLKELDSLRNLWVALRRRKIMSRIFLLRRVEITVNLVMRRLQGLGNVGSLLRVLRGLNYGFV